MRENCDAATDKKLKNPRESLIKHNQQSYVLFMQRYSVQFSFVVQCWCEKNGKKSMATNFLSGKRSFSTFFLPHTP